MNSQYRCETCKHRFVPDFWANGCDSHPKYGKWYPPIESIEFINNFGCASHSDFRNQRETYLCAFCGQYSNTPHDHHVEEIQKKIREDEYREWKLDKVIEILESNPFEECRDILPMIAELRQEGKVEK